MINRISTAYAGTVYNLGSLDIARIRAEISDHNAYNRRIGLSDRNGLIQYRLVIRPRLGKNNPARDLYAKYGPLWRPSSQDIKREHGTRFDLYVHRRFKR